MDSSRYNRKKNLKNIATLSPISSSPVISMNQSGNKHSISNMNIKFSNNQSTKDITLNKSSSNSTDKSTLTHINNSISPLPLTKLFNSISNSNLSKSTSNSNSNLSKSTSNSNSNSSSKTKSNSNTNISIFNIEQFKKIQNLEETVKKLNDELHKKNDEIKKLKQKLSGKFIINNFYFFFIIFFIFIFVISTL